MVKTNIQYTSVLSILQFTAFTIICVLNFLEPETKKKHMHYIKNYLKR